MSVPKSWRAIAADLERRLRAGEWPPGAKLPTYQDLATEYGVGVSTMQRAVWAVPEGLIEHAPGRGLYAAE